MKLKQLLFMLMCALFATNFYAADIYVSASGSNTTGDGTLENPYATIVHAYPLAASGDVIKVVGTLSSVNAQVLLSGGTPNRSITIEGTDATATIADYNSTGRNFLINTAGYTGTVTFRNLIFLNNISSNAFGGSVFFNNQAGATVNFENCTFTGNSTSSTLSTNGGGAIAMTSGTLTITNCNFSANTTAGELGGGAIYVAGATNSTISGTTFYNNTATNLGADKGRGGAINFNNTGTTTNTITNCTFFENKVAQTANFHGAAIRVNSSSNTTSVTVSNSLFYNNLSNNGTGSPSDFNASGTPTLSFTNSLGEYGNNIDITTGSIINNGGVAPMNVGVNLATSNLTWNGTLNKVTFTAPTLLANTTPIDFGSDNSDVGSWDSKINLFKGTTDSDWATGTNWSSTAAPTSLENVTLLSDSPALVIGGSTNATINNLFVDALSSLTINAGGTLIASGTTSGTINYKVNVSNIAWHLVSSPVTGATYDATWMTNNEIASGSINSSNRGISTYQNGTLDPTTGPWVYVQDAGSGTFGIGSGYSLKKADAAADFNYTFSGTYTSGTVSPTITQNVSNWNLIGNPYSAYIDVAAFLGANATPISDAFESIYVWNGTAYTSLTTGYIHPGQAFFVNAASASTTIDFTTAMASHQTAVTFYKTNNTSVNLTVNNGSYGVTTYIDYLDGKTKGLDPRFDLGLFDGVSSDLRIFTHLLTDSQGINFYKQTLPNSDLETMIVPVGVKADAGKEITFTAEAMNLPGDIKVFLEDRLTNTITRLDEANSSYKVTLNDALNGTGRFFLHTKASGVLSTDEVVLQNTSIYAINNNTLKVVGLPSGNANVKMYNILGKQVMQTSFSSTGVKEISLPKLATGMYIIQLETATGKLNKKIVLE